eukprot:6199494-Pleurochrysis_carterae.AAC.1
MHAHVKSRIASHSSSQNVKLSVAPIHGGARIISQLRLEFLQRGFIQPAKCDIYNEPRAWLQRL